MKGLNTEQAYKKGWVSILLALILNSHFGNSLEKELGKFCVF